MFWEEIGSHWGAHGHYRSKERLARWHFSYEKSDIFDVGTMRAEMHMKKIEERMKKVNGKPYLRTRFVIRATRQRALSLGKSDILDVGTMRA